MQPISIKIFADGASIQDMIDVYRKGLVKGFTTNPTLMQKAGICNYEEFAREVLRAIQDLPISFEVFADVFREMERQARKISHWGRNVFVKIPITNTRGESSVPLIGRLSRDGIKVNVTAILTLDQVESVSDVFPKETAGIVSIFAGRIADTGRDPMPIMREAVQILKYHPNVEVLWASSREILNIFQAELCGCHIITVTNDILGKLSLVGKDLTERSLETVRMFYADASRAGFRL